MDLIGLLTVVILVALALYVVRMLITDPMLRNVFHVVIVVFFVLYLLRVFLGAGPILR
jgi:hypothetical protein